MELTDIQRLQYIQQGRRLEKDAALTFDISTIDEFSEEVLPSVCKERVRYLYRVCEEILFDNFDIQLGYIPKFTTHENEYGNNHDRFHEYLETFVVDHLYIIIKFDNIKISNSRGEEHQIKDLFTRIRVTLPNNPDSLRRLSFGSLEGLRTTISNYERAAGYSHSHLISTDFSRTSPFEYQSFCTGTGDINAAQSLVNSQNGARPEFIKLYLLQIEPMIRWESIEGAPYKYISDIYGSFTDSPPEISNAICAGIYMQVLSDITRRRPSFSWRKHLTDRYYTLVENDILIRTITEIVAAHYPDHILDSFIVNKTSTGRYYVPRDAPTTSVGVYEDKWIPFKKQKIFFTVEATSNITPNVRKYINPNIITYVRTELEKLANSYKAKEAGLKWLTQDYCPR